ncbi:T9SS type A sorting domain-containing protein [candidate division KSB1 bacterium]|nr:T9SS type A sorting domain-containing protein [candidate division KSB1 bacterium]
MKHLIFISLVSLVIITSALAQEGQIVDEIFFSPSLDTAIALKIYLPPDYSEESFPYPLLIDLHGAGGMNYLNTSSFTKPYIDTLISSGEIRPLVVVWPDIKCPHLTRQFFNYHNYLDSILHGKYESVISVDLLNWLEESKYNVSSHREHRALSGFSMGGEGSARMAIRNSEKFVAFVSHDGMLSTIGLLQEVPLVLSEYSGPPYRYSSKKVYTDLWIAYSMVFSPNLVNPNMPEWQIDFPLDSTGAIIDSIFYDRWMANFDPATLIQNPSIYTNDLAIYFNATEEGKPYNDPFHHELDWLGIPHKYNTYPGSHALWDDAIKRGLRFLDKVFAPDIVYQHDIESKAGPKNVSAINAYLNYTPKVQIRNIGQNSELNISVTCEIDRNGYPVYSDKVIVDSLKSLEIAKLCFERWHPLEQDSYDVTFYTSLSIDENKLNDTLKTSLTVSELVDDFESDLYKWHLSEPGWGISEFMPHSGNYCLNDSPEHNSQNNANTWIVTGTDFDFSRLQKAHLSYWTRYFIEKDHDFGYVEISPDSGQTWSVLGEGYTGNSPYWKEEKRSLSQFCGSGFENVHLRFRLVTDSIKTLKGWFLDDIAIHPTDPLTEVTEADNNKLPKQYALFDNYPNPFNSQTIIRYYLPQASHIKLQVYNLLGQKITTLIDKRQNAGHFEINWGGEDNSGKTVASGIYFYRLEADEFSYSRKMLLLK